MRGGVPLAARAKDAINRLKGAVLNTTPRIKGENEQVYGERLKKKAKVALKKLHKNEFRWVHGTSKYLPHQGVQECARRVRQGVAGTCYIHGEQYPSYISTYAGGYLPRNHYRGKA